MSDDHGTVGTPQHFRWLYGIVTAVLILNLADACFTLWWIYAGHAKEANPLLAQLILSSPMGFMVAKLTLVGGGSWLLWHHRRTPLAVIAIFVAFLAYYAIFLWHVGFAGLLAGERLWP